jgi:hypothetical protein
MSDPFRRSGEWAQVRNRPVADAGERNIGFCTPGPSTVITDAEAAEQLQTSLRSPTRQGECRLPGFSACEHSDARARWLAGSGAWVCRPHEMRSACHWGGAVVDEHVAPVDGQVIAWFVVRPDHLAADCPGAANDRRVQARVHSVAAEANAIRSARPSRCACQLRSALVFWGM